MKRPDYLTGARSQGIANAHAAVAEVRRWGGSMERVQLRALRLGRGADRAVRCRMLIRNDGHFCLPNGLA